MRTELTAGVVILSAALLVWWRHRRHRSIHALSLPLPSLPLLSRGSRDRAAGRFYIVSGGAQGCGEAIARLLAIEGAAGLTLCDRETTKGSATAAAIEAETGCRTIFMHTELGDIASCAHALDAHDAAFKRLDGLINAAATTSSGNWDDTSADLFDTVYAINVRAPFLLMQGAARLMRRDGLRGSVVNIGSVHCHGGMPKLVAYASSKAALLNLTRNFAFAQRKYGIRANYVALGWTATPTEHRYVDELSRRGPLPTTIHHGPSTPGSTIAYRHRPLL